MNVPELPLEKESPRSVAEDYRLPKRALKYLLSDWNLGSEYYSVEEKELAAREVIVMHNAAAKAGVRFRPPRKFTHEQHVFASKLRSEHVDPLDLECDDIIVAVLVKEKPREHAQEPS